MKQVCFSKKIFCVGQKWRENSKSFFYVLEIVSVVITFLAKPMPQSEDINWNIQTGNVIQMLHPGNVKNLKKISFDKKN